MSFSALITDINPGGGPNGWEVAKCAREVNGALPVIYVTGAGGRNWQAKGVPDSAMIGKPFNPDQLVAAVGSLIRRE